MAHVGPWLFVHGGMAANKVVGSLWFRFWSSKVGVRWCPFGSESLVKLSGWTFISFEPSGVPKDALGWIPSLDMRYCTPAEGARCGGQTFLHTNLAEWVAATNRFYQEALEEFKSQPHWRDNRSRGGEAFGSAGVLGRNKFLKALLDGR